MDAVYITIGLLIAIAVYFCFAISIGRKLKTNVATQTRDLQMPVLPTVSHIGKYKKRRSLYLTGSNLSPKQFGLCKRRKQTWLST